ncbi:MAG: hypothetical protein RL338_986 [Chloroflexota bacterium]
MEPLVVLAAALVGLLVIVVVALARFVRRERRLARILGSAAAGTVGTGLEGRVRSLVAAADAGTSRQAAATADLAVLVGDLGLAVVRTDEALVILGATPAATRLAGREQGAMSGRPLIEAFADPRLDELARRALGGTPVVEELPGLTPDAPSLVVRAARAGTGGVWIVLEDASELRRLRRIRTEFVDNLSHELRTPVTTLGLLAEALGTDAARAEPPLPPRVVERIAKIEDEAGHLAQMANELLDLARIESGTSGLALEPLDLAALVGVAAARLTPLAERAGVAIEVSAVGPLPPVAGDELRLGQVLANLIHNAVRFSPSGGTIGISVEREGDEVAVRIRDEGIGIADADRARIFERFYKADRSRGRGGGTGLGLSIAKHIVEAHGGRIGVESAPGAGSTFTFSIPVARADA